MMTITKVITDDNSFAKIEIVAPGKRQQEGTCNETSYAQVKHTLIADTNTYMFTSRYDGTK